VCRRVLLEIAVYLAMHPRRIYDVGAMFVLLAWFLTRPRAWAQLLISSWLGGLSAATYFFHLALHFCSCDGRERTPRASAGPGRRFDHQSALCTQGASSALRALSAWTIWPIISFSLTLPLTLLVVAYYVSVTLVGLASLSPAAFLALLLVAYSVAATLTALIVGLVLFTSFITQIIGFVALAVVDSVTMLPIQFLIECITLAGTITTAAARRLSATLAGLAGALDRWAALHDPATAELTSALHRGWVGKKRCPTRDRHDVRRALRDLTAPTRLDKLVQTHRHVMMVLGDDDPSVPRLRQITTVYARVALIVLTTITARAYRLGSRVIKRIEGLTLNVGLAIAARLLRSRGSLVAHACFLSGRSGIAWCAFDSLLVATYLRLYPPMVLMRMRPFWILALLPLVSSAGDESKRVPSFSGERIDFTAWFMLFSAYVAYKLVSPRPSSLAPG